MSTTMLDRTFPTTVGFRVASGFDLPTATRPESNPGFAAAAGAVRPTPLPALSVKLPATPPLQPNPLPRQSLTDSSAISATKNKEASTPTNADQLGWKGLLEISRNSGASGVLGSKKTEEDTRSKDTHIEICCTAHTSPAVRRLVKSVVRGLKACQEPEATKEGMGGTYFFTNENGRKVAIMKPCDEEPLAPNNPKGYVGRALGDPGWKPTVRVGEAAMREVAAYLLDQDGFAKVPTSVLVRARHPVFCYNSRMSSVRASSLDLAGHPDLMSAIAANAAAAAAGDAAVLEEPPGVLPMKLGSLQEFVYHECDTTEMGPSRFSARDVHRIGILDIRLFNTDRHAGNMLVRTARSAADSSSNLNLLRMDITNQYELIPIDHGFCLPETLEAPYFEWLHWPQAQLPFSEDELAYIARIDVDADKELLRKELPNLRPECLRVMELSTRMLQRCAEAGLTLYEIGSILTRPYEGCDEDPSDLEKLAAAAKAEVEAMSAEEIDEEGDDACIVEEDECEEDCCEEEGGEAGCTDMDGQSGPTCRLANAASGGGSREDESMLFVLDDESAAGAAALAKKASSGLSDGPDISVVTGAMSGLMMGGPHSPGNSSMDSSIDHLSSYGTPPVRTPNVAAHRMDGASFSARGAHTDGGGHDAMRRTLGGASGSAAPLSPVAGGPTTPVGGIASSVHITDGFLWRRMKTRQAAAHMKRHGGAHHKRAAGGLKLMASPQAYPPPVVAFSPESLNGLFSDMDDRQWGAFMNRIDAGIAASLRGGKWRQAPKDTGVAMSCPRF
mmetsp:Transcript_34762/g.88019  ORF Transcript_34762/g.88019 Transcript_34762/m.88019 type:complete len:786 (-) Transcript_34762:2790-5147(-)